MAKIRNKTYCVACSKLSRGKPDVMRLQITHADARLFEVARRLGLASTTWRVGDFRQAPMHKTCFRLATLAWQIAFDTRALSPRR